MSNQPKLPVTGVLELTYKCNHKCLFCSCPWENDIDGYPKYEKGTELNLSEWKKAMDILADNGVKNLSLSGGETLLKPELPEIIAYIREKNVFNKDKYIVVISNGLAMNEEYLRLFKKYKVHLSLSLPGINTFEKHTGIDNSLGVLHWLRRASKEGVNTTANITVTNINYHELRETISYAFIAGADTLLLNRFLTGGRGIRYQDELSLTHEQINGMLDTAEDVLKKAGRWGGAGTEIPFCVLKKYQHLYEHLKFGFLCAAAKGFFVVDPSGKIRACNHSPRVTGHIFDKDLITDIDYWNRFASRDYIPDVCSHCTDISICDCGCREAANITAGSIRGVDPCMKGYENEMSQRVETIDRDYINDFDKKFENDFRELFTEHLKEDSKFGCDLWSSMANVSWIHEDDPEKTLCRRSFRGAGALLAVMEGKDKYTKWYCSGPYETVSGFIAQAMASRGWRYEVDGYGTDIFLEEKMNIEEIFDPAAQVAQGDLFYNGEGDKKDFTQAVFWYTKAAEQGYAEGQYFLGYCYYAGEGVDQDFAKAVEWYEKAAEQNDARAQQKLGSCYYFGEGAEQNFEKAADLFIKSAEQGRPYAQYLLGFCYFHGQGVEKDQKLAAQWFAKSAEQGEMEAQFCIGDCYLEGDGVEEDHEKAAYWYAKAAEQDHITAQFKLAYRYLKGDGVECDNEKAIFWYTKSAEQGFDRAQYSLAICYKYGEGTEIDLEKAAVWFEKAAKQGDADSCSDLAQMYFEGEGVEFDFEKGAYWFKEAASTGVPKYMLSFGVWLLGETARPQERSGDFQWLKDKDAALQWIMKAADMDEHDDDYTAWEARWILAEIYEYGFYEVKKDINVAKRWYEKIVESGDESAAVYANLLGQGKEDPVNSRGWESKHLISKTIAEYFPEFDIAVSLYERGPDFSDVVFTEDEKVACLPIAEKIIELAELVKRENVLALAEIAGKENDVYFKTSLKLASESVKAELYDEVIGVLFVKERPEGAVLLSRFIIHRGVYLIIRGDFSAQRLKILLASCYIPRLLMPKTQERKYKITFNYLLTHREIPVQFFLDLNMFYQKVLPDPEMMQRFLLFSYNRAKYLAEENPDIEPPFEIENFEIYLYGDEGRQVLIITLPKCDNPPESYQIAIPVTRQKAAYYTCEFSIDPLSNEPCFIFGEWNAEKKHTNYGKIDMECETGFAKMAVEIAYGKPIDNPPLERGNMKFDTPSLELYCEKCETTSYFYDDNEPPYICDSCGAELEADSDGE